MFEARLWKLLRNSEAQPKFTLSYKKNYVYIHPFSITQTLKKLSIILK